MRPLLAVMAALLTLIAPATRADFSAAPFLASEEAVAGASRAMGFCRGMHKTVQAFETYQPELVGRALLAESVFHQHSGNACANVETTLRRHLESQGLNWAIFVKDFEARSTAALGDDLKTLVSREAAFAVLTDIEGRANGNVAPEIAAPLLAASTKYWTTPSLQWPRWTRIWSSKGHPKAHGYEFAVRAPIAFREGDPTAANMLRKWTRTLGTNGEIVGLSVSIFPTPGITLEQMVEEMSAVDPVAFAQEVAAFPGSEIVEAHRGGLMLRPAIFLESKSKAMHLQIEAISLTRMVMVPSRVGLVSASCVISAPTSSKGIQVEMTRYQPLCDLFFGSLSEAGG